MRIGDQEITRNDMPSQIEWQQVSPEEHLRQSVQDIFATQNIGVQLQQEAQVAQGTKEEGSTQWS